MNSRERLATTLQFREPDRVPFDLGSTQVTGIHVVAYRRLRDYLGLPPVEPRLCDHIQQLALPDEDVMEQLGVDVGGLFPLNSHNWNVTAVEREEGLEYTDEWGITHRCPRPDGLYYSVVRHPLAGEIALADVDAHPWPNTADPRRIDGLRSLAMAFREQGRAVMIKGVLAGIFEMSQRTRGMEQSLMDLVADEELASRLLDRLLERAISFWEMALPELSDVLDVISLADDFGTQTSQLVSPQTFRRLFKPRYRELIGRVKQLAPRAKLFFHSCGNVRPLLPDFIELGVDIVNPVHIRAAGMEPESLKRDFGRDLVFWGGGVDTQDVLPHGTPEQVAEDVRRNIEALAPGGGFVFNTVHNIQADVPPENIMAMRRTLQEYGVY